MRRLTTTAALTVLIIGSTGAISTAPAIGATSATATRPADGTARIHDKDAKPAPRRTARPASARLARTYFVLTRTRTTDRSSTTNPKIVTLSCDPTGGTHPAAAAACQDLNASQGGFERAPGDTICTMQYAPVTVTATGYWNRAPKQFRKTYGNECVMRTHTGDIFHF